jgi:hypothetical protein
VGRISGYRLVFLLHCLFSAFVCGFHNNSYRFFSKASLEGPGRNSKIDCIIYTLLLRYCLLYIPPIMALIQGVVKNVRFT